ncbi:hypothetical protein NEFER03_1138 [Nematocida sp. LUAm3]|nr:hypothetical protein NEFER03_1138 [Nematocida sp. LUAm3]KAI5176326.1 hypothetical protein NEFER02_2114 [Nematocida sp. LUAm2]KAI5178243.1 hypothetical protein NEFER01_1410 [Nematocida sp. LUAm1]
MRTLSWRVQMFIVFVCLSFLYATIHVEINANNDEIDTDNTPMLNTVEDGKDIKSNSKATKIHVSLSTFRLFGLLLSILLILTSIFAAVAFTLLYTQGSAPTENPLSEQVAVFNSPQSRSFYTKVHPMARSAMKYQNMIEHTTEKQEYYTEKDYIYDENDFKDQEIDQEADQEIDEEADQEIDQEEGSADVEYNEDFTEAEYINEYDEIEFDKGFAEEKQVDVYTTGVEAPSIIQSITNPTTIETLSTTPFPTSMEYISKSITTEPTEESITFTTEPVKESTSIATEPIEEFTTVATEPIEEFTTVATSTAYSNSFEVVQKLSFSQVDAESQTLHISPILHLKNILAEEVRKKNISTRNLYLISHTLHTEDVDIGSYIENNLGVQVSGFRDDALKVILRDVFAEKIDQNKKILPFVTRLVDVLPLSSPKRRTEIRHNGHDSSRILAQIDNSVNWTGISMYDIAIIQENIRQKLYCIESGKTIQIPKRIVPSNANGTISLNDILQQITIYNK